MKEKKVTKWAALLLSAVITFTVFTACSKGGEEETTTEPHESVWFMLESLPSIDAYRSKDIVKYFDGEGALSAFEPGAQYGGVVPYFSSRKTCTASDGRETNLRFYGIASADGRIITEPIYTDMYSLTSTAGKTVYIGSGVSQNADTAVYDIITADGSKLIRSQINSKSGITVVPYYNLPCECILVPGYSGTRLYDFNGNLIVNLTDAFGADCYFDIVYCDGEKIIFGAGTTLDHDKPSDSEYYCIDKSGKLIYTLETEGYAPVSFDGGCFILRNSGGKMRLSDVIGNIITGEKTYDDIMYDNMSKVFWCIDKESGTAEELLPDGSELYTCEIENAEDYTFRGICSKSTSSVLGVKEGSKEVIWLTDKGETVTADTEGMTYIDCIRDDTGDYVVMYYEGYADFYNAEGTYISTLKGIEDCLGVCGGMVAYRDTSDRICIRGIKSSAEYRIQLESEAAKSVRVELFSDSLIALTHGTDRPQTSVYNISQQKCIVENIEDFSVFETRAGTFFTGTLEGAAVLLDMNGEKIISVADVTLV